MKISMMSILVKSEIKNGSGNKLQPFKKFILCLMRLRTTYASVIDLADKFQISKINNTCNVAKASELQTSMSISFRS